MLLRGEQSVGSFRHGELAAAQSLLARAFQDNPLNRAVIGSARQARLRANLHGMRAYLPQAERHGLMLSAHAEERLVGVLSSIPPGAYPLPPPSWMARLRCLMGQGLRVAHRWATVYQLLHEHHLVERHWYLGTLGVEPGLQGQGIGTELLAVWLRMVDADGLPAYLETDTTANIRFYERASFEVLEEIRVLGVSIWTMRRSSSGGGEARRVESL